MKKYEKPQLEEIKVQVEDVIAASGDQYGNGLHDVVDDWGVGGNK